MVLLTIPVFVFGFGFLLPASMAARPWTLVLGISVIIGFLMVMVFRYTSNQKAIRRAKDRLKANLLAVRLFQDQLPVVLRAYGRILLGTGSYLRLAFTPFLIAIIPITFLIIHLDRYLGWRPIEPQQAFLVEVQTEKGEALDGVQLQLPPELVATAPAVHIPKENEVVWRLQATRAGCYEIHLVAGGQAASKQVVVSRGLSRVSPVRLRDNFWERMLSSGEAALGSDSHIQSISVGYPARDISFIGWQWNWIVLFFVLSLTAGFIFKTIFRIQI
jgi:hypothetical protein